MSRVLQRHGWTLDHIRGSHHVFRKPGVTYTVPVPVHGNRTLKKGIQHNIMKRAALTEADL
jgi:predicted RNA binding protein YcfA (HicA-like mRNA interferase family)